MEMPTKLGRALRAKYRTPQAAMRALGLDEDLLLDAGRDRRRARDEFSTPEGTPNIARKVETMPPQRMSAEDDEEEDSDDVVSFRRYLRRHGFTEAQIGGAIDAGRGRHSRRGNGRDAAGASYWGPIRDGTKSWDSMPPDRFTHNYASDRCAGNDYTPYRGAMDSAPAPTRSQLGKLHKRIPELRRFDTSMDTSYVPRDPATYYR